MTRKVSCNGCGRTFYSNTDYNCPKCAPKAMGVKKSTAKETLPGQEQKFYNNRNKRTNK